MEVNVRMKHRAERRKGKSMSQAAGPEKRHVEPTPVKREDAVEVLDIFQELLAKAFIEFKRRNVGGVDQPLDHFPALPLDAIGEHETEAGIEASAFNVEEVAAFWRECLLIADRMGDSGVAMLTGELGPSD